MGFHHNGVPLDRGKGHALEFLYLSVGFSCWDAQLRRYGIGPIPAAQTG